MPTASAHGSLELWSHIWRAFAETFLLRSRTKDWKFRDQGSLLSSHSRADGNCSYATVLDLQSASRRKYLNVTQFISEDDQTHAVAWMERFGDPTEPQDAVDLLRVNYWGTAEGVHVVSPLLEKFLVEDVSLAHMKKAIGTLGLDPVD